MGNLNLMGLAAAGVVAAVLSVIIGQYKPEFRIYLSLCAGIFILTAALSALSPVFEELSGFAERAGISGTYAGILLKALAVCYITGLAADACRDAGEGAIANKLELAGKAAVTIVSLPIWRDLAELVVNLTNM